MTPCTQLKNFEHRFNLFFGTICAAQTDTTKNLEVENFGKLQKTSLGEQSSDWFRLEHFDSVEN